MLASLDFRGNAERKHIPTERREEGGTEEKRGKEKGGKEKGNGEGKSEVKIHLRYNTTCAYHTVYVIIPPTYSTSRCGHVVSIGGSSSSGSYSTPPSIGGSVRNAFTFICSNKWTNQSQLDNKCSCPSLLMKSTGTLPYLIRQYYQNTGTPNYINYPKKQEHPYILSTSDF